MLVYYYIFLQGACKDFTYLLEGTFILKNCTLSNWPLFTISISSLVGSRGLTGGSHTTNHSAQFWVLDEWPQMPRACWLRLYAG